MGKLTLIVLCFFISAAKLGDDFNAVEYVRNYDGDTLIVNLIGLPPIFGLKVPVRLSNSDTPEINGKTECERGLAITARDEVRRVLTSAKIINLKNAKRDKYFRIVADIEFDGENLSSYLINKKLAIAYDGRTRKVVNWCNTGR